MAGETRDGSATERRQKIRKAISEDDEAWRVLGLRLNARCHMGLEGGAGRGAEEMPVARPLIFPWQPYKHIER